MELVFSDEFNQDGRTFYPGDDPYWEAADMHYWSTNDLEWYDVRVAAYVCAYSHFGTPGKVRSSGYYNGQRGEYLCVYGMPNIADEAFEYRLFKSPCHKKTLMA